MGLDGLFAHDFVDNAPVYLVYFVYPATVPDSVGKVENWTPCYFEDSLLIHFNTLAVCYSIDFLLLVFLNLDFSV